MVAFRRKKRYLADKTSRQQIRAHERYCVVNLGSFRNVTDNRVSFEHRRSAIGKNS